MSLFSRISEWFQFRVPAPDGKEPYNNARAPDIAPDDSSAPDEFDRWLTQKPPPSVAFAATTNLDSPPANEQLKAGFFYKVTRGDQPKWALFLCPCGCGDTITLSLQKAHYPRWTTYSSRGNRPSLRPSVWRDVGCFSHFILQDGRIYWCNDTGISPDIARKRFQRIA